MSEPLHVVCGACGATNRMPPARLPELARRCQQTAREIGARLAGVDLARASYNHEEE